MPRQGLSSIFLPRASIYSALDDPASSPPDSISDSRSPFSAVPVDSAPPPRQSPTPSILGLLAPSTYNRSTYDHYRHEPLPEQDEDTSDASLTLADHRRTSSLAEEDEDEDDNDDDNDEGAAPPKSIMIEDAQDSESGQATPTATSSDKHDPYSHSSSPPPSRPSSSFITAPNQDYSSSKPSPLSKNVPSTSYNKRDLSSSSFASTSQLRPRPAPSRARSWNTPWWTGPTIQGRRFSLNPRERALWRWVNVEDLDGFLQEVYAYYAGKGMWCISLSRVVDLLTIAFVVIFSSFMLSCIDYRIVRQSHSLSEIIVPKCYLRLHGSSLALFVILIAFLSWRVLDVWKTLLKLRQMHEFFTYLLEIPEDDIQSIPWNSVVNKMSALRVAHPPAPSIVAHSTSISGNRLDAHDVANRIMREENYLIALFNKEILNLDVPIPPSLRPLATQYSSIFPSGQLTRVMEKNLRFCVLEYLFGVDGQVRTAFMSERNRPQLIEGLKRRFIIMGFANAIFAPFIIVYYVLYYFLRNFEEYHKNPSTLGSRSYTSLAKWKFREYNELPHAFQQRMHVSYPIAKMYMDQFPKEKVAIVARLISFMSGSFVAVLLLFTIVDPDAFLHFDITPDRTVLFYLGVFTTTLAVARGLIPEEYIVANPTQLMQELAEHTHYLPSHWTHQHGLHSTVVFKEFSTLYQLKLTTFVAELVSVVTTPLVLLYSLPQCAPKIIDFFRECTIEVDGLGYACSFAIFDLKQKDNATEQNPNEHQKQSPEGSSSRNTKGGSRKLTSAGDARWGSSHGKMEKSLLTFKSQHPDWMPQNETTSLYLSRMTDATRGGGALGSGGGVPSSIVYSQYPGVPQHHQLQSVHNTRRASRSPATRFPGSAYQLPTATTGGHYST